MALAGVITDPTRVEHRREVMVDCEAPDVEIHLINWLNAADLRNGGERTDSWRASGEEIDVARHEPAAEVEGATYTWLFVGQERDGAWVAQCVVDV